GMEVGRPHLRGAHRAPDERHPAVALQVDRREPLAQRGARAERDPVALRQEEVEQVVDDRLDDRREVTARPERAHHALDHLGVPAHQDRLVERELRSEVVLDREGCHAAGARQLAQRHSAIALAREQALGAIERARWGARRLGLRAPPGAGFIGHATSKPPAPRRCQPPFRALRQAPATGYPAGRAACAPGGAPVFEPGLRFGIFVAPSTRWTRTPTWRCAATSSWSSGWTRSATTTPGSASTPRPATRSS